MCDFSCNTVECGKVDGNIQRKRLALHIFQCSQTFHAHNAVSSQDHLSKTLRYARTTTAQIILEIDCTQVHLVLTEERTSGPCVEAAHPVTFDPLIDVTWSPALHCTFSWAEMRIPGLCDKHE